MSAKLLENGFSSYAVFQLVAAHSVIDSIEIAGGTAGDVRLLASDDFYYPIADGESVEIIVQPHSFVYAPVVSGGDANENVAAAGARSVSCGCCH